MSDDLERRIRQVLVKLALLPNGRTSSFDASRTGGGDVPPPSLGFGDAPHRFYGRRFAETSDVDERERLLEHAEDALRAETHSQAEPTSIETKAARDERLVRDGEGVPARDVAIAFRTGVMDVRRARRDAGRDPEMGYAPREGEQLDVDDRRAEVRRLAALGMTSRAIAFRLDIARSTVLRDLGRKKG